MTTMRYGVILGALLAAVVAVQSVWAAAGCRAPTASGGRPLARRRGEESRGSRDERSAGPCPAHDAAHADRGQYHPDPVAVHPELSITLGSADGAYAIGLALGTPRGCRRSPKPSTSCIKAISRSWKVAGNWARSFWIESLLAFCPKPRRSSRALKNRTLSFASP